MNLIQELFQWIDCLNISVYSTVRYSAILRKSRMQIPHTNSIEVRVKRHWTSNIVEWTRRQCRIYGHKAKTKKKRKLLSQNQHLTNVIIIIIQLNNLSNPFNFSIAIENAFAAALSDLEDALWDFSFQYVSSCWIDWMSIL